MMSPNQFTLFNQNKHKLSYTISAQEKQKQNKSIVSGSCSPNLKLFSNVSYLQYKILVFKKFVLIISANVGYGPTYIFIICFTECCQIYHVSTYCLGLIEPNFIKMRALLFFGKAFNCITRTLVKSTDVPT